MEVYLLRHGIAVEPAKAMCADEERPLAHEGTKELEKIAPAIIQLATKPDLVLTSPLVRAQQTAAIAAEALGATGRVQICQALVPEASPEKALREIAVYGEKESLLLVGHEPQMSALASLLIGSSSTVLEMKKASLCFIQTDGPLAPGAGYLKWLLTAKQMKLLAKGIEA